MTDAVVIILLLAVAVLALRGARTRLKDGCCGGGSKPKKVKPQNTNIANYTYKSTIYIDGMTCEHCKTRVENAFNSLPDCYAKVNLKQKCANLWTNERLDEEKVIKIVQKSGYTFVGYSNE
ncbi:MAG: heavy metal-associated domain-containing protein [Clostridia bacterium]|nr:heavy metal-associated domain-containing protein [Clostridia bacterium]